MLAYSKYAVVRRANMSRKQERQLYWMLIAALSLISISMTSINQFNTNLVNGSGNTALKYSESELSEGSVVANKLPEYEEGKIDKRCHLPTSSSDNYGYYSESAEDEEYDESEEYYNDKGHQHPKDDILFGPCSYNYPNNVKPAEGFLDGIDFYHLRSTIKNLEICFSKCIDVTEKEEFESSFLVQVASIGLTKVSLKLMTKFGYDPAFISIPQEEHPEEFNAVQAAIRGGHALTVKALTKSNNAMVIDRHGRTVADYIDLKGSPIRPTEAKSILGLIVRHDKSTTKKNRDKNVVKDENNSSWSSKTVHSYDDTCNIDILEHEMHRDEFFKEYYSTGRPFVLRGHVPKEEAAAFSKDRWNTKRKYNTHQRRWSVGPTAYPSKTGQEHCSREFTITEIENCTKCPEMPDSPMVTAWHPNDEDFELLYPMYNDKEFYESSGWRKIDEWFGSAWENENKMS